MDLFLTRDSLETLLNLPEESEKHLNAPARTYVRDTKAMASTAVDVKELPKAYVFVADMPGLKPSDVQVQLENANVLVISGERKEDKPEEDVKYLRVERRPSKFMRKFTLPNNADLDKITASCADGVVTITVPKVPPPEILKTRSIKVSSV